MENIVKKLEEQVAFLQHEISQMSDELYSQQKEITELKKEISNFKNNKSLYIGEKITIPEHMIQSAMLAEKAKSNITNNYGKHFMSILNNENIPEFGSDEKVIKNWFNLVFPLICIN